MTQGRTLKDYRPQHDEDCDWYFCRQCNRKWVSCVCGWSITAKRKPCTCGLDALLAAEGPQALRPIPAEWTESANLARGLCESEARKWETADPATSKHWERIAVHLGGLYLTQDHLGIAAEGPQPEAVEISFEQFAAVNRERCESPRGFNHALSSWSTSDWFTAIIGEFGEAANIAKKLNRVRDGIPGNKETEAQLRDKLRRKLGNVFVYLDLLAQALGFNIGSAAVDVFNAKSEEIGCPIKFAEARSSTKRGSMGEKVTAEELNKMKLDFGHQDGPRRGEARCEKCGTIYPAGTPHGCKINPTK